MAPQTVEQTESLPERPAGMAAFVAAYTVDTARTPAQVEAALQAVTAQAAAGAAAVTGGWWLLKVVVAAGVLTGAVALVWSDGSNAPTPSIEIADATAVVSLAEAAVPQQTPAPIPSPPPSTTVDTAVDRLTTPTTPPAVAPPAPPAPVAVRPTSKAKRARPSVRPAGAAAVDANDGLDADLALLNRARAALRAGDAKRALSLVQRHRTRTPASVFVQERDATEVMALCAVGQPARARAKAASYAKRFPDSERDILGACASASLPGAAEIP